MFFITRGSQIIDLVNAIIDSVAAIAKDSVGVAATMVEMELAKAIPVAIGFLAGLLSLGDISGTIRNTIEKAQAPVNKAIDWAINQAVKLVKAAGRAIGGLFGIKDKEKKDPYENDPDKAAKVSVGIAVLDQLTAQHALGGQMRERDAKAIATTSRAPVFKTPYLVVREEFPSR